VHALVAVTDIKEKDVDSIVDPAIRERIRDWYKQESRPAYPVVTGKNRANGEEILIPIKKVRVVRRVKTFPIGVEGFKRDVKLDANHHLEVFDGVDDKGKSTWDGEIVDRYRAARLSRLPYERKPLIVNADKVKFTLAKGEIIRLHTKNGPGYFKVVSLDNYDPIRIKYISIYDARPQQFKDGDKKVDIRVSKKLAQLREMECQKVTVDPLGEVRTAND
jgi:hypothetical protein